MGAAFTFNIITPGLTSKLYFQILAYIRLNPERSVLFSTLPSCQLRKRLHLFIDIHASVVNILCSVFQNRFWIADQTDTARVGWVERPFHIFPIPIPLIHSNPNMEQNLFLVLVGDQINIIALFVGIYYLTTASRWLLQCILHIVLPKKMPRFQQKYSKSIFIQERLLNKMDK